MEGKGEESVPSLVSKMDQISPTISLNLGSFTFFCVVIVSAVACSKAFQSPPNSA